MICTMRILSAIGTSFLITSLMMPTLLSSSYGYDGMWIMYSILAFVAGLVFIVISAIRSKQQIEYELYKKQRLNS
jgi:hypothetical protein